jgi:hypothetical protein|tara:strand:+ start:6057 stop:6488 length:432 start_codon:yes stop_codon:yes gene_type:complete
MYKYLIALAILTTGVVYAQVTVKDEVNTELAPISASIDQKQSDYFSQHGKYWQGIKTLDEVTELEQDSQKNRKADGTEDWVEMGIPIPNKSKYSYQVDNYKSPQGWGYTITTKYKDKGNVYMKVENHGPETHRARDWALYNPP